MSFNAINIAYNLDVNMEKKKKKRPEVKDLYFLLLSLFHVEMIHHQYSLITFSCKS